jgi:hypothetical protein
MRILVVCLLLLAGLKVWTQDRMYRSVMTEALIDAYRQRAVDVCRKQTTKKVPAALAGDIANLWGTGSKVDVMVGNPDLEVAIWDTQNPEWPQRFQHPNLILTGARDPNAHCAYDMRNGVATISR